MHRSFYYYIAAAAATAIAGILHLVYASNVIDRSPLFGIFFIVAGLAAAILGITYDKAVGKIVVLYRNRWYVWC